MNKFYIGSRAIISGSDDEWNGTIDEPFFINRPLYPDEVLILNNSRWWNQTHADGKYGNGYYGFDGRRTPSYRLSH